MREGAYINKNISLKSDKLDTGRYGFVVCSDVKGEWKDALCENITDYSAVRPVITKEGLYFAVKRKENKLEESEK